MHANGDIERGYPPVLPLASRGALVGATPLLMTGTFVENSGGPFPWGAPHPTPDPWGEEGGGEGTKSQPRSQDTREGKGGGGKGC